MDIVQKIVLVLHFIGLASLLGGFLQQVKEKSKNITAGMLHGALTQLVTGIALVGLLYANDEEPNNTKIAIKFSIIVVITVLVWMNRKKRTSIPAIWATIGGLTVANIAIAVFV